MSSIIFDAQTVMVKEGSIPSATPRPDGVRLYSYLLSSGNLYLLSPASHDATVGWLKEAGAQPPPRIKTVDSADFFDDVSTVLAEHVVRPSMFVTGLVERANFFIEKGIFSVVTMHPFDIPDWRLAPIGKTWEALQWSQ